MHFHIAIELAVFIGHEGQIEMNSKLEMRLLSRLVDYMKKTNLSRLEHALAYIYLKCWGPNAKQGFYAIKLLFLFYIIFSKNLHESMFWKQIAWNSVRKIFMEHLL